MFLVVKLQILESSTVTCRNCHIIRTYNTDVQISMSFILLTLDLTNHNESCKNDQTYKDNCISIYSDKNISENFFNNVIILQNTFAKIKVAMTKKIPRGYNKMMQCSHVRALNFYTF